MQISISQSKYQISISQSRLKISPIDLGVKMEKIPGVIKGRFYVTTSLSDSWEPFTPLHAGVTLGRFLHQLVVAFFSPTSMRGRALYMGRFYTS